jgi:hypothetical protein
MPLCRPSGARLLFYAYPPFRLRPPQHVKTARVGDPGALGSRVGSIISRLPTPARENRACQEPRSGARGIAISDVQGSSKIYSVVRLSALGRGPAWTRLNLKNCV